MTYLSTGKKYNRQPADFRTFALLRVLGVLELDFRKNTLKIRRVDRSVIA